MVATMIEPVAARVIAIQRLITDSGAGGVAALVGSRIYRDVAPAGVAYPLVTVSFLSALDLATANGVHVWTDVLLLVKVTDQGASDAILQTIARRVFDVLDQYERVSLNGIYVTKFRRTEVPMQPDEYENGQRYSYANQVFRCEAEPA